MTDKNETLSLFFIVLLFIVSFFLSKELSELREYINSSVEWNFKEFIVGDEK